MYKIAVVGDYDSIYGFAALGLDTFPVYPEKKLKKNWSIWQRANMGSSISQRRWLRNVKRP